MKSGLTSAGRSSIAQLADQQGFTQEAVEAMLDAIVIGGGGMAQFDHAEFGGSGQWMRGGLIMISDPADHALKSRIDSLCSTLAEWVAREADDAEAQGFQRQSQTGGGITAVQDSRELAMPRHEAWRATSLFERSPAGTPWWPASLGEPSSTGSQNGVRYAWFGDARRLAVDRGGEVTLYDTGEHRIAGFSQQQGGGTTLLFTSQHGTIEVDRLPEVAADASRASRPAGSAAAALRKAGSPPAGAIDPFVAIEKLAQLHARGVLSDAEFLAKKEELLKRI